MAPPVSNAAHASSQQQQPSSNSENNALSVPALCRLLQSELSNAGKALMCPICRCTITAAATLPCQHAYCAPCLRESLKRSSQCPTCKESVTRRSVSQLPQLQRLARIYKQGLPRFGLAPVQYEPSLPMTQVAPTEYDSDNMNDSDDENDDHHPRTAAADNTQNRNDMAAVARVFCRAFPPGHVLHREQQSIVAANQKHTRSIPASLSDEPTWTQLAQDATNQAAADQAWEDAQEEDENDDALAAKPERPRQQQPSAKPDNAKDEEEEEEFMSAQESLSQLAQTVEALGAAQPQKSPPKDRRRTSHVSYHEFVRHLPTTTTMQPLSPVAATAVSGKQQHERKPSAAAVVIHKLNDTAATADTTVDNYDDEKDPMKHSDRANPPPSPPASSSASDSSQSRMHVSFADEAPSLPEPVVDKQDNFDDSIASNTDNSATKALSPALPQTRQKPNIVTAAANIMMSISNNPHNSSSKTNDYESTQDDDDELTTAVPNAQPDRKAKALRLDTENLRKKNDYESTQDDDDDELSVPNQPQEQKVGVAGNPRRLDAGRKKNDYESSQDDDDASEQMLGAAAPHPNRDSAAVGLSVPLVGRRTNNGYETTQDDEPMPLVPPPQGTNPMNAAPDQRYKRSNCESSHGESEAPTRPQPGCTSSRQELLSESLHDPLSESDDDGDDSGGHSKPTVKANNDTVAMTAAVTLMSETQAVVLATPVTVWPVGTVVQVHPRTWPGMNRPGGVGRITKAYTAEATISYDVQYVLGGRERHVDGVFVSLANDDENDSDDESEALPSAARPAAPARLSKRARRPRAAGIPTHLLEQLAAEGFDTSSNSARRAKKSAKKRSTQDNQNQASGKENENRPAVKKPKVARKVTATKKRARTSSGTKPELSKSKRIRQKPPRDQSRPVTANAAIPQRIPAKEIPKLSKEDMETLSMRSYCTRIQEALRKGTVIVVASSLPEADAKQLNKLVKLSKEKDVQLKVSNAITNKTTLCVLPAHPDQANRANCRTLKALRSALRGIPLVPHTWISECMTANQVMEPNSFIHSLPSPDLATSTDGVIRLAAHLPQRKPLDGLRIHVCGSLPAQKLQDISTLVKESGAEFLNHPSAVRAAQSPSSTKLVVLCEGASAPSPAVTRIIEETDAWVVDTSWLFDTIAAGQKLTTDRFAPTGAKARTLWKAANEKSAPINT